jgi:hypothetical protein
MDFSLTSPSGLFKNKFLHVNINNKNNSYKQKSSIHSS